MSVEESSTALALALAQVALTPEQPATVAAPTPAQVATAAAPTPAQVAFAAAKEKTHFEEESSTGNALALALALGPEQVATAAAPTPAQVATAAAPTPSWVMLRAAPRVQKAGLFVKDVQLELLPPPAISYLTVSDKILSGMSTVPNFPARHPSASSDNSVLDPCPYVVAVDPTGGGALLLCVNRIPDQEAVADAAPADYPRPRYVLCDTLSDTFTVLVSPHQPGSMGLARRGGAARGQLVVAGLTPTVGEDKALLSYCKPKLHSQWVDDTIVCKGRTKSRVWGNNGVVAVGSKLFWVDHAQGLVSCDIFSEEKVLSFISFPVVRDSTSSTRRRVQAIGDKLIMLQTDWVGGDTTLVIWRLVDEEVDIGWIREHTVRLTLASTSSSVGTEVPMVVLADPHHPSNIFVLQATCVFCIDALKNTVTEYGPCFECEADILSELIYAWELPPALLGKLRGSTGCWDSIAQLLSLVCKPLEVANDEEDASRRMLLFFRF